MDLGFYNHANLVLDVNKDIIPVTVFDTNDEGMEKWNEIYSFVVNSDYNRITRTRSGGISISRNHFFPPMYDVLMSNSVVELTILNEDGMWRFQFRTNEHDVPGGSVYGKQAFRMVAKKFEELTGRSISEYYREDGMKIRDTIPSYLVKIVNEGLVRESKYIEDAIIYDNVHHIDFRSSFGAGLVEGFPEFETTIRYFFNKRHVSERMKGVLNSFIGNCWSRKFHNAGYSILAKAAIENNNKRVMNLVNILSDNDRIPLLLNTDGIWYYGDVYHGAGEGRGLGEWSNDHMNCKIRIKSRGCYEYIENGIYYPVARGVPKEVSSKWNWGGIYTKECDVTTFYEYKEGKGIEKIELESIT